MVLCCVLLDFFKTLNCVQNSRRRRPLLFIFPIPWGPSTGHVSWSVPTRELKSPKTITFSSLIHNFMMRHFTNIYRYSMLMGVIVAFKPSGFVVGGRVLDANSVVGNLNVYKCVEGFMESIPQGIYQLSIMFRTPMDQISKNKLLNKLTH